MGSARRDANHDEPSDPHEPLGIQVRHLRPLEIVLVRRYVHNMPVEGFPAFDRLADDLERQLKALPTRDLPFAREVYGTFAASPYPADRLHAGLLLRSLTLVDHEAGLALWHQLVRDEHPVVRRDTYEPIHRHLTSSTVPAEQGLAQEGLTLADGHQLRDAFIGAQYLGGCHVVGETAISKVLQEATRSFESIARL